MIKDWIIKVFIDNRGTNVIKDWLENLPKGADIEIETRLKYLKTQKTWIRPYAAKLKGSDHIYEIRIKFQKNQYRPLGFFGPGEGEFTLLAGAVEKNSKFEPHKAVEIAERRRTLTMEDKKYIDDYFKI